VVKSNSLKWEILEVETARGLLCFPTDLVLHKDLACTVYQ